MPQTIIKTKTNVVTKPTLGVDDSDTFIFRVHAMGKPRMTQRDKWAKRPTVVRYFEIKDELVRLAELFNFTMPSKNFCIRFYLPVSTTWSNRRKEATYGTPHAAKPDIDNLAKAIFDSLCKEDSFISEVRLQKFWCRKGEERVEIEIFNK